MKEDKKSTGGEDPTEATSYYGRGTGTKTEQRGSSGSDGGFPEETNTGDNSSLSERGGGTGIRETEDWVKNQKNKGKKD